MDRTLCKTAWTHHAHLRVGLWHVREHGAGEALRLLRERIRAYNAAVGTANTDSSGYHETLTAFYVHLIAIFVERDEGGEGVEARLIAALGPREVPLRFYSRERLFSVEARRGWVEPDLRPLPAMTQGA